MKIFIKLLPVIVISLMIYNPASADIDLTLIETLSLPDSIEIRSVSPVGDFNADGYGDLLIGIYSGPPQNCFEAAYLYYGGFDFDTEPDLIFIEEQQGEPIGFGWGVGLNDFNGDGYDDLAISAGGHNHGDIYQGRTYIYFGSPNPDTTADLIIDGERFRDFMAISFSGDFNGDGLGDAFFAAPNDVYGPRLFIYLGSSPPDNICDWLYDYTGQEGVSISKFAGGYDLNGDGRDEYSWYTETQFGDSVFIFLGRDTLSTEYDYLLESFIYLIGDISLDGIDDLIRSMPNSYLCLGGDPFDIEPDYYMWEWCVCYPYLYTLSGVGPAILKDNRQEYIFYLYHTGIPFDTAIYSVLSYGQNRSNENPCIGDINADGIEDLAIKYMADTLKNKVFIYSMIHTDIDEDNAVDLLPHKRDVLLCYPNPFNSSTVISYSNLTGSDIEIYDIRGRLIKTFHCRWSKEGNVNWDASSVSGEKISSGIYFVRMNSSGQSIYTKLLYLK